MIPEICKGCIHVREVERDGEKVHWCRAIHEVIEDLNGGVVYYEMEDQKTIDGKNVRFGVRRELVYCSARNKTLELDVFLFGR